MKIKEYLATDENAYKGDLQIEKLLSAKEKASLSAPLWKSIATGEADVTTTLIWVTNVAKEICNLVIDGSSEEAATSALHAIGLQGRIDKYALARDLMEIFASFDELDKSGNPLPKKRWSAKKWLEFMREHGLLKDVKDKTAINKLNSIRNELGIR